MARFQVTVDPELEPIMARYLELRLEEAARLVSAAREGDFETVCRIGHNLKGNGSSYGLAGLSELGLDIERAGRERDPEQTVRLAGAVRHFIDNVDIVYGD